MSSYSRFERIFFCMALVLSGLGVGGSGLVLVSASHAVQFLDTAGNVLGAVVEGFCPREADVGGLALCAEFYFRLGFLRTCEVGFDVASLCLVVEVEVLGWNGGCLGGVVFHGGGLLKGCRIRWTDSPPAVSTYSGILIFTGGSRSTSAARPVRRKFYYEISLIL